MATEQAATMPMPPPSSSSSSTSNDFFNYIVIYDTISACTTAQYDETYSFFYPPPLQPPPPPPPIAQPPQPPPPPASPPPEARKAARRGGGRGSSTTGGGGSKKRRRKARVCKNKEEAETQRMTHIAVERNRRKLMNEHLALLKSLMPPSYVQRGDQASIVAGATEFVKELEHLLHSLQAQKLQLANQNPTETAAPFPEFFNHTTTTNKNHHHGHHSSNTAAILTSPSPSSSSYNNDETMNSNSSSMSNCGDNGNVADVEVTLIETHANLRILLRRNKEKNTAPLQLSKLVCGFHALGLGVLHFSLNTVHPFALYSVSAKVEEGCQLSSVEDIAAAVHHMLRLIVDQEEENLLQQHY